MVHVRTLAVYNPKKHIFIPERDESPCLFYSLYKIGDMQTTTLNYFLKWTCSAILPPPPPSPPAALPSRASPALFPHCWEEQDAATTAGSNDPQALPFAKKKRKKKKHSSPSHTQMPPQVATHIVLDLSWSNPTEAHWSKWGYLILNKTFFYFFFL